MNLDALQGLPGEITQCTKRFMLFTYITYFADTGFWETGQLQSPIQNYNFLFSAVSKKKSEQRKW